MTWITGVGLLVGALIHDGSVPVVFGAGYASFMFARELVALPVLAWIQRSRGLGN